MKLNSSQIKNLSINSALQLSVLFIVVPLFFSLLRISTIGRQPSMYIQIVLTVIIVLLYSLRKKITWEVKTHTISIITVIAGFAGIYNFGLAGGYYLCFLSVVLIALIHKRTYAFIYLAAFLFGFTVIATAHVKGWITTDFSLDLYQSKWTSWASKIFSTTLLLSIIIVAIGRFIDNFEVNTLASDQEQKKFRALFNQTYSFITMLDENGRIMEVNEGALFYIDSKLESIKGKYFPDAPWWTHSMETKQKIETMLKASLQGDFKRFEISHLNHDGRLDYFDYTLKPIFDEDANIQMVICEGRDITKIKLAEQALIESEQRLLALSEATVEGIIITKNGAIVDTNKSALTLFGYTREEVIGKNAFEKFIPPKYHSEVMNYLTTDAQKPYEIMGYKKDGTKIPIEIEGRTIPFKGEPHRVAAIRDLTEQKKAQHALIESEEKYRLIAENLNDTIWKFDLNLNFTYVSASVYPMLGYTTTEIMELQLKDIMEPNSYDKVQELFKKQLRLLEQKNPAATHSVSEELLLIKKDNSELWVQINAKLMVDENGFPVEILGVTRDIDELKKLNSKLVEAKEQAIESDKLKSAFLANMSHEIRTPMNSIIGFSKMCLRTELSDTKKNRYAQFVIENGKQLLAIVNDILDFSKIEAGQIKIKKKVINLNELIDNQHIFFQQQNNKGLLFLTRKSMENHESYIMADDIRVKQVISNLLNNAFKFTERGQITLGYNIVDNNIVFFVEDSGMGIPLELQDKIFERFRQVDLETTRVFGGTGLGLSITQKLVQLMGGKIWLYSIPEQGSTFYVTIPYEQVVHIEGEDSAENKSLATGKKGGQTLLIAEDEESNFIYLEEILREYEFKIRRAKTGKQAVDICKSGDEISLILMDVKMPVMDGFQATKLIKEFNPNIPIIAQTAFAMVTDRDSALEKGCDDYIAKPIDPDDLISLINKYLNV